MTTTFIATNTEISNTVNLSDSAMEITPEETDDDEGWLDWIREHRFLTSAAITVTVTSLVFGILEWKSRCALRERDLKKVRECVMNGLSHTRMPG